MKIFVMGYKGLIGSQVFPLAQKVSPPLWVLGDGTDVCINCAGFTDVDGCETDPVTSYNSNVGLVERSRFNGNKYVLLSTDFIFNGEYGPYTENSDPSPISVYGAQKWIAETLVRSMKNHLIVRTTCVYGWHPKKQTFAHWVKKMCETDKPFFVTERQCTTPTYAPDLARIIMQLIEKEVQGIVNVVGPEYMDRYTMACEIAEAFGYDPEMVKPSQHVIQKARRPDNGGLIINKLRKEYGIEPQPFHESLKEMIETWGK